MGKMGYLWPKRAIVALAVQSRPFAPKNQRAEDGCRAYQQRKRQAKAGFGIGDAASMIPPFTGNGMSMAFQSAECALQPALDYTTGGKAWLEAAAASSARQRARFKRRLATATVLHHFLMNRTAMRITRALARRKMMPFGTLLRLVR